MTKMTEPNGLEVVETEMTQAEFDAMFADTIRDQLTPEFEESVFDNARFLD